ncbi:MAG: hypothetical protein MUC50_13245 [Myxococcota bacterium]|jgi:hypothetical protein|nr:hypothetical protein [Myxococcota bacterium]
MRSLLRKVIGREEFDYLALLSALSSYSNPRNKITALLRDGTIIRVKKGLYVFGDQERRRPFSRELLANLIYGPSFISLDFALFHHGLIPERPSVVTSVTLKRSKEFETPVGSFSYRQTPRASFNIGMSRIEQDDVAYLMACPERALADKLSEVRGHKIRSQRELGSLLFDDLRLEPREFAKLNAELIEAVGKGKRCHKSILAALLLRKMTKG